MGLQVSKGTRSVRSPGAGAIGSHQTPSLNARR